MTPETLVVSAFSAAIAYFLLAGSFSDEAPTQKTDEQSDVYANESVQADAPSEGESNTQSPFGLNARRLPCDVVAKEEARPDLFDPTNIVQQDTRHSQQPDVYETAYAGNALSRRDVFHRGKAIGSRNYERAASATGMEREEFVENYIERPVTRY
jgi:hypothetical protein